jgi:hypothetical protein
LGVRADLFVASECNYQVLRYDWTTGAFVKTFASGGGLSEPEGLVFTQNGDLFVSEVFKGGRATGTDRGRGAMIS